MHFGLSCNLQKYSGEREPPPGLLIGKLLVVKIPSKFLDTDQCQI